MKKSFSHTTVSLCDQAQEYRVQLFDRILDGTYFNSVDIAPL